MPRWRDLQPLLIRSAGVVGIVATIMAVVSSDALRFGNRVEIPPGRNDPPASAAEAASTPVVAAASELGGPDRVAARPAALAGEAPIQAGEVPIKVVAVDRSSPETPALAALTSPVTVEVADLRTGAPPDPAPAEGAPLTTASVPADAPAGASLALLSPSAAPAAGAPALLPAEAGEISVTSLQPPDVAAAASDGPASVWQDGAAKCLRDWVEGEQGSAVGDCLATDALLAPVADDVKAAIEGAAAEHAEILAALPRVPLARPAPPPDFQPSNPHTTRVRTSRNSSWPDAPPPNCAAGKRARWHFVDRQAGTKEWYCR